MKVPVSEAKGQLTELVRLAEAGEEVVLTRFGKDAVRLIPGARTPSQAERLAVLDAVQASARAQAASGKGADDECAERSQDFLYDEDGLPV